MDEMTAALFRARSQHFVKSNGTNIPIKSVDIDDNDKNTDRIQELTARVETIESRIDRFINKISTQELLHTGYPTVAQIVRIVGKYYGHSKGDMIGPCRQYPLVHDRQVAMYLCRILTLRSLPEIGRRMGKRDHTTILHGIRQVQKRRLTDSHLCHDLVDLEELIKALSANAQSDTVKTL